MDEPGNLFEKVASEQWFPAMKIMAKVIKRMVFDRKTNIPASEIEIPMPRSFQTTLFASRVLSCVRKGSVPLPMGGLPLGCRCREAQ